MLVVNVNSSSLSELEAVREISRESSRAVAVQSFMDFVGQTVLRIAGIRKLQIENEGSASWGEVPAGAGVGTALIELVPGSCLRLSFDLQGAAVESPLKLVRFLAQQIQSVLTIAEFTSENRKLREQIRNFDAIVERRKTIHRARAILCGKHNVSEVEALTLMRRYSGMQQCSLHEVAAAIVACEVHPRRRPRTIQARPRPAGVTIDLQQRLSA